MSEDSDEQFYYTISKSLYIYFSIFYTSELLLKIFLAHSSKCYLSDFWYKTSSDCNLFMLPDYF